MVAAVVAASSLVALAPAGAAADLKVSAFNFGYNGVPDVTKAALTEMKFINTGTVEHELVMFQLTKACQQMTREQAIAAADTEDFSCIKQFVGAAFAPPGGNDRSTYDLRDSGRYVFFCFFTNGAGVPHYKLDPGMVGFIKAKN